MMSMLNRLADGVDGSVRRIGEIMAWTGLALVLVIAFNVCARYLVSFGAVALQETEWHLMAVGALFGVPYALNRGEEVRVDVFYGHFSPGARRIVNATGALLLALASLVIAYLSLTFVQQSFMLGEGSADPGGLPARWLLKAAIPISFLLLALQSLSAFIRQLTGATAPHEKKKKPGEY
ncbi:TRAP transporter small permease subunit [Roseibium aggregatum]|uniref:TRAP transporter small permease protein n=1 Tax=Roseibium aggregatum TaxID=187304 RepID=A0A939ECQ7_9HYPH|nr:TRAP transporter small permease subunit [Roseibium aggregatum]MBN9670162.1 TRAP transporter small permease subunit [Roseibium aggregatum]